MLLHDAPLEMGAEVSISRGFVGTAGFCARYRRGKVPQKMPAVYLRSTEQLSQSSGQMVYNLFFTDLVCMFLTMCATRSSKVPNVSGYPSSGHCSRSPTFANVITGRASFALDFPP